MPGEVLMGLTVLAAFDNDDIVLVAGLLDRVLHDKYYFIIDQRCTFGTPTYQIAKHIYESLLFAPRPSFLHFLDYQGSVFKDYGDEVQPKEDHSKGKSKHATAEDMQNKTVFLMAYQKDDCWYHKEQRRG